MGIVIDDSANPAANDSSLNLKQVLNSFAFILKQITGQTDWKTAPVASLIALSEIQGQPGDKGDIGEQGLKGDKGDTGATGISAVASHPGFLSGRYYASGFYSSFISALLLAGVTYYSFFFIPFDQAFTAIAFQINTGSSNTQKARVAIYTINNGLPYSLVKDFGEISGLNSNGIKGISNSFSLSAGWYAIAISTNESIASFLCPSMSFPNLIGVTTIGATVNGYRAGANYGAFPNTAIVSGLFAITTPVIWLKTA